MPWIYLLIAGSLKIVGLLALANHSLPLGPSFLIWTGIGAFVPGAVALAEPVTLLLVPTAATIVAGMITMKVAS